MSNPNPEPSRGLKDPRRSKRGQKQKADPNDGDALSGVVGGAIGDRRGSVQGAVGGIVGDELLSTIPITVAAGGKVSSNPVRGSTQQAEGVNVLYRAYLTHSDAIQQTMDAFTDLERIEAETGHVKSRSVVRTLASELKLKKNQITAAYYELVDQFPSKEQSRIRSAFGQTMADYAVCRKAMESFYNGKTNELGEAMSVLSFSSALRKDANHDDGSICSRSHASQESGPTERSAIQSFPVPVPPIDYEQRLRKWLNDELAQNPQLQVPDRGANTHPLNPLAASFQPSAGLGAAELAERDSQFRLARSVGGMWSKNSLLTTPSSPFDGDPTNFVVWKLTLETKMIEAGLTSLERVAALRMQTTGAARELVDVYGQLAGSDPAGVEALLWDKLQQRFGRSVLVASAIRAKLRKQPVIRETDTVKLRAFSDQLNVVAYQIGRIPDLAVLNTSSGTEEIRSKLPQFVQLRWRKYATNHEAQTNMSPSFKQLADFVSRIADEVNNRNHAPVRVGSGWKSDGSSATVSTFNTDAEVQDSCVAADVLFTGASSRSAVHKGKSGVNNKTSAKVSVLKGVPSGASVAVASTSGSSQKLSGCAFHPSESHTSVTCPAFNKMSVPNRYQAAFRRLLCFRCLSRGHRLQFCPSKIKCDHCDSVRHHTLLHRGVQSVKSTSVTPNVEATVERTDVDFRAASCALVVLVRVFHASKPGEYVKVYCILDLQSTNSFCSDDLRKALGLQGKPTSYRLTTVDRHRVRKRGYEVSGLRVCGVRSSQVHELPTLLSTDQLPNATKDVATPSMVRSWPHLRQFSTDFEEFDPEASVGLLIGRDALDLTWLKCFGSQPPYAFQTRLGFAMVGSPASERGGSSAVYHTGCDHFTAVITPDFYTAEDSLFKADPFDEMVGMSQNDREFLTMVEDSIEVNKDGKLSIGLPFKRNPPVFPDNQVAVRRRTEATLRNMKPEVKSEALLFMKNTIDKGHAELVPEGEMHDKPVFYLPPFAVVHPQKRKVRVVQDAAAQFNGVSLNNSLLSGPDANNRLRSVLQRFRERKVGVTSDVEQMFHSFSVRAQDRNVLRFYWPKDSVEGNPLVVYRHTVHIFGATCSPAIAILGLRQAVKGSKSEAVRDYINRGTYMDDAIGSFDSPEEAISVLKGAREQLALYKIRLHKISSSHQSVMDAFPATEHAEEFRSLGTDAEQRTLGIKWRLRDDVFWIAGELPEKAYTKRGLLSAVHAVFDPIGYSSPVMLTGKLLLREVMEVCKDSDWDDEIPESFRLRFDSWKETLHGLTAVALPRVLIAVPKNEIVSLQVHGFCDASEEAVAVAVYLRVVAADGGVTVTFAAGESKVTPRAAGSIPRKELCSGVLLVKAVHAVKTALMTEVDAVWYHTDSEILLGWLNNRERRFKVYVTNRTNVIRKMSNVSSWLHVCSAENAADVGTRAVDPGTLQSSSWLIGPRFLREVTWTAGALPPYRNSELPEAVADVEALNADVKLDSDGLAARLVDIVSSWKRMREVVVSTMKCGELWIQKVLKRDSFNGFSQLSLHQQLSAAGTVLVIDAQQSVGWDASSADLRALAPFLDDTGVLRVGGRLRRSPLAFHIKHPVVLPGIRVHQLGRRIIEDVHRRCGHQGRHITMGALQEAGFHVVHGGYAIKRVLGDCITCKELRAPLATQFMADLPIDRMTRNPPFTEVAIDLFGPYEVRTRTTRRAAAIKVWVLTSTCLYTRGVWNEVLPGYDTTTLINGIRKTIAARGAIRRIRADQGTNIVGAISQLRLERELCDRDIEIVWELHAPSASHHGGVIERKVLSVQRVLEFTLKSAGNSKLFLHDFETLVAEAASVVNSTPLGVITSDPNDAPLSPSMLITMKGNPHPPPTGKFTDRDAFKYGIGRWRFVQLLADRFDAEWHTRYLQELQRRNKWILPQRSFRVGDVVLLQRKQHKRNEWPKARIKAVKVSADGHVRTVTLTMPGEARDLDRPITDLVLLLRAEDDHDDINVKRNIDIATPQV